MSDYGTEFTHTEKVFARLLESNETIVTSDGLYNATAGQYVVKRESGFDVMEATTFETYYGVVKVAAKTAK